MTTEQQRSAARKNSVQTQQKWRSMSERQRALAQPEGRGREKPGLTGKGDFYWVVVRRKSEFTSFRNQDVGDPGHILRLAGRRRSGSWATHAWLVSKKDAHLDRGELVADTRDAEELLDSLGSRPIHEKGDIFRSQDRRNVPESAKPTAAQKRVLSRARFTNMVRALRSHQR